MHLSPRERCRTKAAIFRDCKLSVNDNMRCEKDGESCRYDPEMGGVRIEHVAEVTSEGCRNLTEMEICLEV